MQRMFIKKYFLFTVGSVCRVKRYTTGSRNVASFADDDEKVKTEMWKWLRQQSKDFYAAGSDALVKRRRRIRREIHVFPRFEYHIFYVLLPFVTYLLTLSRRLVTV
jgi:hypothetical protein